MNTHSSKGISYWFVAYSPYVDTLHVYHDSVNTKKKDELIDKDFGKYIVVYDAKTSEPLLFEMKHASQSFRDIDNMDKEHIIQRVKGYISGNGITRKAS